MTRTKTTQGFGLIEVLVAVAVIAGAALLVSTFVLNQSKGQIQVREKSSCEAAVSSILSALKEKDNNANVVNWLPKAGEVDPPTEISSRVTREIATGYKGTPLGQVEAVSTTASMDVANYSIQERQLARKLNNYQLIESATSILVGLVNKDASYTSGKDPRADDGFLADVVNRIVGSSGVDVEARVAIGGSGCDGVPINVSTIAPTNSSCSYGLHLKISYGDTDDETRSCSGTATISAGSDLQAPTVVATVSPVTTGLVPVNIGGNTVLCGQNLTNNRASFRVTVNQQAGSEERGVQYLCRLDYYQGLLPSSIPNRTAGTGWFLCSLPEAPIAEVNIAGQALSVSSVNASSNTSVSFTIDNAAEGSYRLHVKAVDTARNESVYPPQDIMLDLTRPTLNQTTVDGLRNSIAAAGPVGTDLNDYFFQCGPTRSHTRWNVVAAEDVVVSSSWVVHNYRNSHQLRNPRITCGANTPSPLTAADVNEGLNAGLTAWTNDGPKTADFVACDICSNALNDLNPSRAEALWFLDTQAFAQTDLLDATLVGNAGSRQLSYSAGGNDGNPYIISHSLMQPTGIPASQTWVPYNRYSGRIQTLGAENYPAQPIQHCQPYGTYTYGVRDGCITRPALAKSNQYTSSVTGASVNCAAGGGANDNTRFCPTFTTTRLPVAPAPRNDYVVRSCAMFGLEECNNLAYNSALGMCGERPPNTCKFDDRANRSCKLRSCAIQPAYRHLVGNRSSIEHGEQVYSCVTSNPSCGVSCNCGTVRCDNGSLRRTTDSVVVANPTGTAANCSFEECPTFCPPSGYPSAVVGAGGTTNGTPFTDQTTCNAHASVEAGSCVSAVSGRWCGRPKEEAPSSCVGSWGECSVACGGGTQTYTLTSGTSCSPANGDTRACNEDDCSSVINCVGAWGTCSLTCGGGTQTYSITTPAQNGGVACEFTAGQSRSCNTAPCAPVSLCYGNPGGGTGTLVGPPYHCARSGVCPTQGENVTRVKCAVENPTGTGADEMFDLDCLDSSSGNCVLPLVEHPIPDFTACFVAGTQITLEDGKTKSIESVEVGERILTYDEYTDKYTISAVEKVFHHAEKQDTLFTFTFDDKQEVTSNAEHAFYLPVEKKYMSAAGIYDEWQQGRSLYLLSETQKNLRKILYIKKTIKHTKLYNLHVESNYDRWLPDGSLSPGLPGHNYFANGVLVHNVKWGGCMSACQVFCDKASDCADDSPYASEMLFFGANVARVRFDTQRAKDSFMSCYNNPSPPSTLSCGNCTDSFCD